MKMIIVMGVPHAVKTDHGPVYASSKFASLYKEWGINHSTGIPHNLQGINKGAYSSLKKKEGEYRVPQD